MGIIRAFWILMLVAWLPCGQFLTAAEAAAVQHGASAAAGAPGAESEHHGLPAAAVRFHLGPLLITNSMIAVAIVTLGLVIFAQLATRNIQAVPHGLQNLAEWAVEGLYNFLGGILGPTWIKPTFWFFASLFVFILFTNWFGLIPGVGTVGWGHVDAQGHFHLTDPLLRGGNADLNMTSAMALLFFALWLFWSWRALGVGGILKHLFVSEGGGSGFMKIAMAAIFLFVGVIEVVSIAFRPVSLSFRLFGNVFAGENILESMLTVVPALGWLIPLPFYGLELLVGFVQALVFTLLTAVFTSLMVSGHHGEEDHGHRGTEGGHVHH